MPAVTTAVVLPVESRPGRLSQEPVIMTARPSRPTTRVVLAALALLSLAGPAAAADRDEFPPPRFEGRGDWRALPPPRFGQGPESCRTFVKRRLDADGEEVVRRVRVCDEGPGDREGGYREDPHWGSSSYWHRHRHWDDEPGPGRW